MLTKIPTEREMKNARGLFRDIKQLEKKIRALLIEKEERMKELNDLINSLSEDDEEGYIDEHGYYHLPHAMYERFKMGEPVPPITQKIFR